MDILQNFDLYPKNISLFHKGKKNIRNTLSIVVSIIIIIGMIISIFLFGQDFYKRLNPQIIYKNIETPEYPLFLFNYSNFFVSAALTDFKRQVVEINASYYSIKFILTEHLIINGSNKYNVKDLDVSPCNIIKTNDFAEGFNKKTKLLEGHTCISNFNLTIGGDASQLRDIWLDVRLIECDNSTSNYSCKPKSEIKEFFNDKHFLMNTMNQYVDIDDYINPVKPKMNYFIKYVSYNFFQGVTQYFESLKINTDDGIIFEEISENNQFILKDSFNNFNMYPDNTDYSRTFVQYSIKLTNTISDYKRKYIKAQELAANIGGIFQVYILIGKLIIDISTQNLFFMELINRFYSFQIEDNIDNYNITVRSNQRTDSFYEKLKIKNKQSNKSRSFTKNTPENINEYTTSDILCYSFYCRSKKHHPRLQLFDKLKNEFEGFLEVGKFIIAFKDIELLTSVLLNPEQRSGIHLKNRRYILENSSSDNYESNLDKMIYYFKSGFNNNSLNKTDMRIFSYLRKDIKKKITTNSFGPLMTNS